MAIGIFWKVRCLPNIVLLVKYPTLIMQIDSNGNPVQVAKLRYKPWGELDMACHAQLSRRFMKIRDFRNDTSSKFLPI